MQQPLNQLLIWVKTKVSQIISNSEIAKHLLLSILLILHSIIQCVSITANDIYPKANGAPNTASPAPIAAPATCPLVQPRNRQDDLRKIYFRTLLKCYSKSYQNRQ